MRISVLICPIWPEQLTTRRLKSGKARFSEVGREILCSPCKEYWPADTEFFHSVPSQKDGLNGWCKACYAEWQNSKKAKLKELEYEH